MTTTNGLGIILGLSLGKPAGILLFSFLAVKTRITSLGASLSFIQLSGAGLLGGIGFTMSIFITLLAFDHGLSFGADGLDINRAIDNRNRLMI